MCAIAGVTVAAGAAATIGTAAGVKLFFSRIFSFVTADGWHRMYSWQGVAADAFGWCVQTAV